MKMADIDRAQGLLRQYQNLQRIIASVPPGGRVHADPTLSFEAFVINAADTLALATKDLRETGKALTALGIDDVPAI